MPGPVAASAVAGWRPSLPYDAGAVDPGDPMRRLLLSIMCTRARDVVSATSDACA